MQRATFILTFALTGIMVIGTFGLSSVQAGEEYKTTAQTTTLIKTGLAGMTGTEANLLQAQMPPGWVGGKHYHSGHVFVYVLEGSMTIELEGKAPITVGPGEVFHELPRQVMQAKNASATEGLKIMLFQVGPEGAPIMLKAE